MNAPGCQPQLFGISEQLPQTAKRMKKENTSNTHPQVIFSYLTHPFIRQSHEMFF